MLKLTHIAGYAATLLLAAATAVCAQETIKIGVTSSLTGPAAFYGAHQKWGIDMAVGEINANGGVLGKKLEVVYEDNRCNPAEAVKAVNALISQHEVVAIHGALCSSSTLAVLPVVARAEVPLITSSSTAASITSQIGESVNPWGFRSSVADDGMANAMVAFLKQQGVKRISIVGEESDYGRGGAEIFTKMLEANGMELVSADFVNPTAPDFSVIMTKLKANKPDRVAVYFTSTPLEAFIRQYETVRLGIPLTGRVEANILLKAVSPEFAASGGLDGTAAVNPYTPEIDTPENKAFVAKFVEIAKETPNQPSFMAYEAIHVLAKAIEGAGEATPAAIREGLLKVQYPSILGETINFDETHQAHNNVVVTQIMGGKIVIVGMPKG